MGSSAGTWPGRCFRMLTGQNGTARCTKHLLNRPGRFPKPLLRKLLPRPSNLQSMVPSFSACQGSAVIALRAWFEAKTSLVRFASATVGPASSFAGKAQPGILIAVICKPRLAQIATTKRIVFGYRAGLKPSSHLESYSPLQKPVPKTAGTAPCSCCAYTHYL